MQSTFILFEGPDGAGKTTQLKMAELFLKELNLGLDVMVTREPGSPHIEVNQTLRNIVKNDETLIPIERELLFMADAHQHKRMIESLLDVTPNLTILSDRGYYSHVIYQKATAAIGHMEDHDLKRLQQLIEWYVYKPDYTIIFDVDFEVAKARMAGRGGSDVIERLGEDFLKNVNQLYKDIKTGHRVFRVNGNSPKDVVAGEVKQVLLRILSKNMRAVENA
jgi:dTMP kinase